MLGLGRKPRRKVASRQRSVAITQVPGADPENQLTGFKLEVLGDHALLQRKTRQFLECFCHAI